MSNTRMDIPADLKKDSFLGEGEGITYMHILIFLVFVVFVATGVFVAMCRIKGYKHVGGDCSPYLVAE